MAQCVEHLEGISLDRSRARITQGRGLLRSSWAASSYFGQYFTPRELIAFCVAVLDAQAHLEGWC